MAWSWSGFYLGGHAGYGWGRNPFSDPVGATLAILTGIKYNGFVGGFQAGANWQSGAWVGGLEIDLYRHRHQRVNVGLGAHTGAPGTRTVTLTDKFDLLGSARARLGYLVLTDVLLYGTGGLAWTRLVRNTQEKHLEGRGRPTIVPRAQIRAGGLDGWLASVSRPDCGTATGSPASNIFIMTFSIPAAASTADPSALRPAT